MSKPQTKLQVPRWLRRLLGINKKGSAQIPTKSDPSDTEIRDGQLPRHVAIIMDGNGRWAKLRGLSRSAGHRAGTEAVRGIVRACDAIGIGYLTLYAFSTENWLRPKEEVQTLMALLLQFFSSVIDELDEKNVRIRVLGDRSGLPQAQQRAVNAAMERTKNNGGLNLNIAINYGGRAELLSAAKMLAQKAQNGEKIDDFTEADLVQGLYTEGMPDVDLLIRTSGEKRLSNFLPWQTAYAEIIFNSTLWPDYDERVFRVDLQEYARRDRRFNKV